MDKKDPSPSRSPHKTYRVIGSTPVRPGDTGKVTGKAVFGGDFRLPDMLYGAVLRSPHAHARIRSIDAGEAESMPGVTAVITSADFPVGNGEEQRFQRDNVLAGEKALYYGHPVAAVSAVDPETAYTALSRVWVDYEALPPVVDVMEAMRPEAPILHPGLRTDELGRKDTQPTNIASHAQFQKGDPEKGFKLAEVVIEREFHTATVHQGYIEPHNATARVEPDGKVVIWCSTQGSFSVRDQVSEILNIPQDHIRVEPLEVGGGFGGKNNVYLEPLAVMLSQKNNGRPVQMAMDRSEVFSATGPTSASYIRVKMGADKAGQITAATAWLAYAAGAYPGSPVETGMDVLFSPYRIPNLQVDGYDVVVNRPRAASYRAPGSTNAVFAAEVVVDELCEKLGIDPLEFRLLNGVKEGDKRPDGVVLPRVGLLETLTAARLHPHYSSPLGGLNRGRGIACGGWGNAGGTSSAYARVNPDGTVDLMTGSVDLSATRLTLAMQLAETLCIPLEDVHSAVANTDQVEFTDGTWGSRTTFSTGWAVYQTGLELITLMKERAVGLWEVDPGQVEYSDGRFTAGEHGLTFREMSALVSGKDHPVESRVTVDPQGVGMTFGTHIVDVEVDVDTGKVQILRYTAIQDAGKAIHPTYVEGQIQGAVTQGIGWGLAEEYIYDEAGRMLNAGFQDYRLPTSLDIPSIEAVVVEVPNPGHPYGVRGVGEMSITPPPAAIANAIYRAVGVRMEALPMTPERVLEGIMAARAASS